MKKKCPDCDSEMIEVRKALINGKRFSLYSKFLDEWRGRKYHEYRFYCSKCKKEWVYNALHRWFEELPDKLFPTVCILF